MNRKLLLPDMAAMLSESGGISKHKAENFIRAFFNTIETGLQEDKLVKIKGFGTFKIVSVSSRESVNVNTGERIVLDEHSKITFTPDSVLKELVNRPFSQFQTVVLDDDVSDNVFEEVEQRIEQELSSLQAVAPQKVSPVAEETVQPKNVAAPAEEEKVPVEEAPATVEETPTPTPLMAKPEETKNEETKQEKQQSGKPQAEKPKKESAATVPPAETPRVEEHVEEPSRSIWKPIVLVLAGILLFALGYLCGTKNIFCAASDTENTPAANVQPDTLANDSLSADSISEAVPMTSLPEHPEGEIRVVGQIGTHVVGRGESIVQIAVKYYGSKDYAVPIINFNELTNPDILNVGQEIKLPRLEVSE